MNEPAYLTSVELASLFGYSPSAITEWRRRGYGPRFLRISKQKVLYRRTDVEAWIEANTTTPTPKKEKTT